MALESIRLKTLRKAYSPSSTVLGIDFLEFHSGQLTCVLGATGCGKTSLLNILAGVDLEFSGEVIPLGSSCFRISYQFQKDLLLPWKTVHENLILGFADCDKQPDSAEVDQWLKVLKLKSVAQLYPSSLSIGMRQRVALGRALLWNGDLKLFDEPLSSQDFTGRLGLEAAIIGASENPSGISIVVTHNLEEAVVLGDRIVVLGGSPARVLDDFVVTGLPKQNRPVAARGASEFATHVARAAKALSITSSST